MRESNVWKEIRLTVSKIKGVKLFRNNVGMAWTASSKPIRNGANITLKGARPVNFGLMKGSGDGIGWRTIEITEDMIGKKIAQFVSIEAKTKTGRVREEQKIWLKNVNDAGGIAIIARSGEEAKEKLENNLHIIEQ